MKLREITNEGLDDFNDLARQSPENDQFGSMSKLGHNKPRKPYITLKHINKLKRMKNAKRDEQERRAVLVNLMYAAPEEEGGME